MARKEDACRIEVVGEMTLESYSSLHLLYFPLIGNDAMQVYHTMTAIALCKQEIHNHLLLTSITGLNMDAVEKSRHVLEQYLLMKTFYHAKDNAYIYQVFMPKDGQSFLRHEVFGRLYMKKMGRQVYEFNKLSFAKRQEDRDGYQEITIPFTNILKGEWQDAEETQFLKMKPEQDLLYQNDMPLSFNYDRFLNGFSKTLFPLTQRNEKNLRQIGELATIHGIDEMMMRKLVSQSMNLKDNTLNLEQLKKKTRDAQSVYQEVDQKHPYQMPPVQFLQMRQRGVALSSSDKYLIETLITEFRLIPEVVNVLIEYVLEKTNQRFTKSYVQKVASVWVRLNIDSADKALQHIEQEKQQYVNTPNNTMKSLPDWYYNQDDVETDAEPVDEVELERLMKQLRGE